MSAPQSAEDRGDVALLDAASGGDDAAFDTFVARHRSAVFRYARAIASSAIEAEEILQSTFIAAWNSATTLRSDQSARAWLFQIARNSQHRMHRRRAGEPAMHADLSELGRDAGWGDDHSELAQRIANRQWVEHSMARLSSESQEILLLIDVEELSIAEAATTLGLSDAATKSRLHRARLRLLHELRREVADAR